MLMELAWMAMGAAGAVAFAAAARRRRDAPEALSEEEMKRIGEFDEDDRILLAPLTVAEALIQNCVNEIAAMSPRGPGYEYAAAQLAGRIAGLVEFEGRWRQVVEEQAKEKKGE